MLFKENSNSSSKDKLVNAVLSCLNETAEGKTLMEKYPTLFKDGHFNLVLTEGEDLGKTALWLLAEKPEGRIILKKYPELLKQGNLDDAPIHGAQAGMTVLLFLASSAEGIELLSQHPELLKQGNLDAAPVQGQHAGRTVLWCLAGTKGGRKILSQHPELLKRGNLDVAPMQGPDAGKTALWILAAYQDGRKLLAKHPELLKRGNLDASPAQGHHAGKTVLWFIVESVLLSYGTNDIVALSRLLFRHLELLKLGNLNAGPKQGSDAGKTVLWLLVWLLCILVVRRWLGSGTLLAQYPELLKRGNLDAAPMQGPDAGKTALLLLAGTEEGREMLRRSPELLTQGNLDAVPVQGQHAGKTVLWYLATNGSGRALLAKYPELLKKADLYVAPACGYKAGKTILWWLIKYSDILKKNHDILLNPTASQRLIQSGLGPQLTELFSYVQDDPCLAELFLLAGAEQQVPWYEKTLSGFTSLFSQSEHLSMQDKINKSLEPAINILFIYSPITQKVGLPILYEIVYYYFFSLYPDLAFLGVNPLNLEQLIDQKLTLLCDIPLRILTLRSVKAYEAEQTLFPSVTFTQEKELAIKRVILSVLREAIEEQLIQHYDLTSEFCDRFVKAIKHCDILDKASVQQAIATAQEQSQRLPVSQLMKPYQQAWLNNPEANNNNNTDPDSDIEPEVLTEHTQIASLKF